MRGIILDEDGTSSSLLLLYIKTASVITRSAHKAPAIVPTKTAFLLGPWRWFGVKTVTSGVWSEGFSERSVHLEEKERHKFPDVLHTYIGKYVKICKSEKNKQ